MSIEQIEPSKHPGRVVVGVDGSKESMQALRWAARLATSSGVRIDTVAAWELPATLGWAAAPQEWDPARDALTVLANTIDEVFGTQRPKDLQLTVRQGGAARVLLEESEGALMLIVGSRGHGGFMGLLLGSVSANVAEHATCPVLVIHGETMLPLTTS